MKGAIVRASMCGFAIRLVKDWQRFVLTVAFFIELHGFWWVAVTQTKYIVTVLQRRAWMYVRTVDSGLSCNKSCWITLTSVHSIVLVLCIVCHSYSTPTHLIDNDYDGITMNANAEGCVLDTHSGLGNMVWTSISACTSMTACRTRCDVEGLLF